MRLDDHQRQVLDRFIDAWHRCDIDALAALRREDVVLSMPPELTTIAGRAQVTGFFATVPAGGRLDTIRLVRTVANGHPARLGAASAAVALGLADTGADLILLTRSAGRLAKTQAMLLALSAAAERIRIFSG